MSPANAVGIRDEQIWESISKRPPGDGAQLDVVVPGDHLLGELPHLLAVEERDVLMDPRGAGHLRHGQRRDRGGHHVETAAVGGAAAADRARAAEVEAGAEPTGSGGARGRPRECGAGLRARVRARGWGRGFGPQRGGGGGGGRCHLARARHRAAAGGVLVVGMCGSGR